MAWPWWERTVALGLGDDYLWFLFLLAAAGVAAWAVEILWPIGYEDE